MEYNKKTILNKNKLKYILYILKVNYGFLWQLIFLKLSLFVILNLRVLIYNILKLLNYVKFIFEKLSNFKRPLYILLRILYEFSASL